MFLTFLLRAIRTSLVLHVATVVPCLVSEPLGTTRTTPQFPTVVVTVSVTLAPFDAVLTSALLGRTRLCNLVWATTDSVGWLPIEFVGPPFLSPSKRAPSAVLDRCRKWISGAPLM